MSEGPVKPCIAKGCKAEGQFGKGSLRGGAIVWACAAHRALLEPNAALPAKPVAQPKHARPKTPEQDHLL